MKYPQNTGGRDDRDSLLSDREPVRRATLDDTNEAKDEEEIEFRVKWKPE